MKRKSDQRGRKPQAKGVVVTSTPPTAADPVPSGTQTVSAQSEDSWPDAEMIYRDAEAEPDFRGLRQYVDAIRVLRRKSFSYRDIASWFSERGVFADHNAIYRAYTNQLSDDEAHSEDERANEEAADEAMRNS